MGSIKLEECDIKELQNLLNAKEEIFLIAENKFDLELLKTINEQCNSNVTLSLRPNDRVSIRLLELIPRIQKLNISPSDRNPLKGLETLSVLNNLLELSFGSHVKNNVSFEPIKSIKTLRMFDFYDNGLEHKTQYEFINQQSRLEKLQVKKLDLALLVDMPSLSHLRVHRTLRNEYLLGERFPNLKIFHLHGDSKREDFSFLEKLSNIEDITINYNKHLTVFPEIQNPERVRRICMLECPNFSDIESLLLFENLETLCLTTYNKQLQLPAEDFQKLKRLKK